MQFTQTSKNYFLSQPHQPFFLFGVLWSIIALLLFGLSYKGVIGNEVLPQIFHSYSLIFIVFTQFFVGFLFTTFPRFCQSAVIEQPFYVRLFFIMQFGAFLFMLGAFLHVYLALIGSAVLLIANGMIVYRLYSIYKTGRLSHVNSDPFWIMMGFGFSLVSHLLYFFYFISDIYAFYTIAAEVGFYNYLIFLAFAVGQRMIPFFSHYMGEKTQHFSLIVFALLLLKSFDAILGLTYFEIFVDIALALYLLKEILRWKLPTFQSPAILWVLHLALYWLPTGLLLGALGTFAETLSGNSFASFQIHLLAIGFLTTVLIGFGTRATLGHSGQPPHADRYATNLFWLVQAAVVIRALYSVQMGMGLNFFWLFDLSLSLWTILFFLWAWRYGAVLYLGKKLSS